MSRGRIVYQDWIVGLGRDPSLTWQEAAQSGKTYNREAIIAVNQALNGLTEEEAAFIRLFYYQGKGYTEISQISGRATYRLETLHRSALKKLRLRLATFVAGQTTPQSDLNCPLCNHPARDEIGKLLLSKTESETWRRIIRVLRDEFGIVIKTPQRLKSHRKYHMLEGE